MDTILVGVDTHEDSQALVDQALALALAFGSQVYVVHVAEPEPDFMSWEGDLPDMRHQQAVVDRTDHRAVQGLAGRLRERGVQAVALQFRAPTADGLVEKAAEVSADLIIVGTHRRGPLLRALLGSVSRRVVDRAPCPVLVVPTGLDTP
jgi:nucleotide-binding universal stress UspA family protein